MPYKNIQNVGALPIGVVLHVRKSESVDVRELSYQSVQDELAVNETKTVSYGDQQHPYLSGISFYTKEEQDNSSDKEPSRYSLTCEACQRGDSIDNQLNTTDTVRLGFHKRDPQHPDDPEMSDKDIELMGLYASFNDMVTSCKNGKEEKLYS